MAKELFLAEWQISDFILRNFEKKIRPGYYSHAFEFSSAYVSRGRNLKSVNFAKFRDFILKWGWVLYQEEKVLILMF